MPGREKDSDYKKQSIITSNLTKQGESSCPPIEHIYSGVQRFKLCAKKKSLVCLSYLKSGVFRMESIG